MSVGVGFTVAGYVGVRDLDGPGCWLIEVGAALRAADEFEAFSRDPMVVARGAGSLRITANGIGFTYTGSPELLADMAAQLRDAARNAAECGAAGHA